MKRQIIVLFACITALTGYAQDSATRGTANNLRQPNVIVVPYTKADQDVRDMLESNPVVSRAVSKVKEEFGNRGFATKDFVTLLKAGKRNDIMSATTGAKSDPVKDIILESKADISVEVKIFVNKHENGASEVSLELQAAEAVSGESFANASYTSDKFITQDSLKLAERALAKINDDFFTQLQNGFNDIMEKGRNLNIRIELGANTEIDPYTQLSTGNDLETELHTWMSENAFGGNYEINSTDLVIDVSMKVPLYDQVTDKPYNIGKIRGPLTTYLNNLIASTGHSVKTKSSSGQQIWLVIQ